MSSLYPLARYEEKLNFLWEELLKEKEPLDIICGKLFSKYKNLGKKDRAIISETIYARTRNYLLIDDLSGIDPWPAAAHIAKLIELPKDEAEQIAKISAVNLQLKYSLPKDFLLALDQELSENNIAALRRPGKPTFRVNTLKTSADQVQQILTDSKINHEFSNQETVYLKTRLSRAHRLLKDSYLIPQDHGSQKVSQFIKPQASDTILDYCAGSGGKSLHLSALMQNNGKITCYDSDKHRLQKTIARAQKAGATNIHTSNKLSKDAKFDVVLVDAPCSGSGSIGRHPEIVMRFSESQLCVIEKEQETILDQAQRYVQPQGHLIYATCSLFPRENENRINAFLSAHKDFKLIQSNKLKPGDYPGEGFYMARLQRQGK